MVHDYIKTVKHQISYFDHILSREPKRTEIQAKFWPLKYEFEKLLEYLEKQQAVESTSSLNGQFITRKTESAYIPSHNGMTQTSISKSTIPKKPRSKTLEIENNIYNIVKEHSSGIHIKEISTILRQRFNIELKEATLSTRIFNMCKKNMLINISKGTYIYF